MDDMEKGTVKEMIEWMTEKGHRALALPCLDNVKRR